jgi:hypothetical protein
MTQQMLNAELLTSNTPCRKRRTGEGGIRTLGSLLGYGALAKRCFQPLSHLTKNRLREYREEFTIAKISLMPVMSSGDAIVDIQNVAENVDRETQRGGNVAQDSIHSER